MLEKIYQKFQRKALNKKNSGYIIKDKALINAYEINTNFPRLVSYPRTGSHWLRMLMELYFEMPSLVYVFYATNPEKFTCIHKHDVKLDMSYPSNFIYLYRDPKDTIYSMLKYDKKDIDDLDYIKNKTNIYARHMKKWLIESDIKPNQTFIKYEELKNNPIEEFKKITDHFNQQFDINRFKQVYNSVNHNKIRERTKHNNQILNATLGYEEKRNQFKELYHDEIMKWFYSVEPKLQNFL